MNKNYDSLRDLYQANHNRLVQFANSFPEKALNGPLLMDPTEYFKQERKLLVVGQETNGWHNAYKDIDAQLECYKQFNLGEKWGRGAFWNINRKVEKMLDIAPCSCAWSNLNRFDQDKNPPTGAVLDAMPSLDFLLREEIQITLPDVCLFYTNRKYDYRLEALYPGVQYSAIEELPNSHFVKLTHPDLPRLTLRTPHPTFIRMKGWEKVFLESLQRLFATSDLRQLAACPT
jgi:hypothetical protein